MPSGAGRGSRAPRRGRGLPTTRRCSASVTDAARSGDRLSSWPIRATGISREAPWPAGKRAGLAARGGALSHRLGASSHPRPSSDRNVRSAAGAFPVPVARSRPRRSESRLNVSGCMLTHWGCPGRRDRHGHRDRDEGMGSCGILVVRAQQGDREAFAGLVNLTSDRMYALAARILRDSDLAEDALQGALITAWRQLPTLRDPDRFEAWVRKVLVHACYAEARRRRSWAANVRVLPVDGPAGPDDIALRRRPRRARPRLPAPVASSSGRSSSCITTWACPWSRSPRRSASRPGRPDRDSTTRPGCCARPSRPTRRRSLPEGRMA